MSSKLELFSVTSLPYIKEPADLVPLIVDGLETSNLRPQDGDILVIAQKLVSKAEGAFVDLRTIRPGERALKLAAASGKDPRLVEVILAESTALVRAVGPHLITEHRLGFVCANAGVDQSNSGADSRAVLLPRDPDASARAICSGLRERYGVSVSAIVSDSHGRAFRNAAVGVAIGIAGLSAIASYRGAADMDGRLLRTSEEAVADELAGAASLLMGQGAEGCPLVLIRGYEHEPSCGSYRELLRERSSDLFR